MNIVHTQSFSARKQLIFESYYAAWRHSSFNYCRFNPKFNALQICFPVPSHLSLSLPLSVFYILLRNIYIAPASTRLLLYDYWSSCDRTAGLKNNGKNGHSIEYSITYTLSPWGVRSGNCLNGWNVRGCQIQREREREREREKQSDRDKEEEGGGEEEEIIKAK